MSNGEDFLSEYTTEAEKHYSDILSIQDEMDVLDQALEQSGGPMSSIWRQAGKNAPDWMSRWWNQMPSVLEYQKFNVAKDNTAKLVDDLGKAEFYYNLYGELPSVLMSQALAGGTPGAEIYSVDDALVKLPPPDNLSSVELQEVRDIVGGMLSRFLGTPTQEDIDVIAEETGLPALKVPEEGGVVIPVGLDQMTNAEIVKALTTAAPPISVMTKQQWDELLEMQGYEGFEMEEAEQIRMEAEELILNWQERRNKIDAFKAGMVEMPESTFRDMLNTMIVQPGLGLLDLANIYFEHVTQPLAGKLWRHLVPDIEAEYQRLKQTETEWKAAQQAWEAWEGPWDSWFLKYVIMEGLVDPLTYLPYGAGIFSRIVRPLGRAGVIMSAPLRGMSRVFEFPFDALKATWKAFPKTAGQRALEAQRLAGQLVRKHAELYTGKHLSKMTMKEFSDALEAATKYAFAHPQSEELAARAGNELLKHAPVGVEDLGKWGTRLGTTLDPNDITRSTIENVDNVFEDFFMRKIITQEEAAGQILKVLSIVDTGKANMKLAARLLGERARTIEGGARAFATADTPFEAMRSFMRRNYKISTRIEESAAFMSRMEKGAVTALLHGVDVRAQALWKNYLDKFVVKPFAEAYLAFGLYGPMNVLEDTIRSTLGGVFPRRMSVEAWERVSYGLTVDPDLTRYGVSEMMGYLERSGKRSNWNNWVIQMATLGQKKWAATVYEKLVRLPGAFGMDMRRNFIARRFQQIFKENGGEAIEALIKAGPSAPTGVNKPLLKEVQAELYRAKTTGDLKYIKNVKDQFTHRKMTRAEVQNIMSIYPDVPPTTREFIIKSYDDGTLFKAIDDTMAKAQTMLVDDFIMSPEYASKQIGELAKMLTELEVRNPTEMAEAIKMVTVISDTYGALPHQVTAHATVRNRGLPTKERGDSFDAVYDRLYRFLDEAGGNIESTVSKLKLDMRKPELGFTDDYISAADSLFDTVIARKEYAAEFRHQNMATRHDIFASTPRAERTTEFWDDFGIQMDSEWQLYELRDAELFGRQIQLTEAMDATGGIQRHARAPIRVVGRALAPQDIASLIGCRGDDISRGLLDVLTVNSKPRFVAYVMGKTRPGDAGFTKEAVEGVYDQIISSLKVNPKQFSYITRCQLQMDGMRKEFWDLHNAKMYTDEELAPVYKYIDDTADAVEKLMYEPAAVPKAAEAVAPIKFGAGISASKKSIVTDMMDKLPSGIENVEIGRLTSRTAVAEYDYATKTMRFASLDDITPETALHEIAHAHVEHLYASGDKERAVSMISEYAKADGESDRMLSMIAEEFREIGTYKSSMGSFGPIHENLNYDITDWILKGKISLRPETIPGRVKFLNKWFPKKAAKPGKPPEPKLKSEYADFQSFRQNAMDEAHKWYYKEYPDYTNANAFDALMKTIYPYWTYESQRWFWLPRSFVRHPGTFTAYERWQDNTDRGYIHVGGTSMDYNPFRGTVYGTLSTRLMKEDYPEYYDSIPLGGFIEGMDALSRYGFYPNVIISGALAAFGGLESQMGETMPAIWKTPLNALIAMFPDNESVTYISDHVFSDRFREYMTILMVNKRGYEGVHIWTKMQEGVKLSPEEEDIWSESRREAAAYGMGFEQFGMFKLRSTEQHQIYEESGKIIEKMTGYTPEQQKWLRDHGYRIWDTVGGLSPTEQAILEELDYYRWMGLARPLLPSKQQLILNKQEMFWSDVESFNDKKKLELIGFQQDFLSGILSIDEYLGRVTENYSSKRKYIDELHESVLYKDVPITLEDKRIMYEEHGVPVPVTHPMRELLNLYFSIELVDKIDEETGEKVVDWDTFMGQREAIDSAIPDEFKNEWEDYMSRNTPPLEKIRRQVYKEYFRPYGNVWEGVLNIYSQEEQLLIKEWYSLRRRGIKLDRQAQIRDTVRPDGKKLISSFQADTGDAKRALRYANPMLDAWLFYWGRTTTFLTTEAEMLYPQIARDTGRKIK